LKNALRLIRIGSALGESVLSFDPDERIQCTAFSPDGRQLACATSSGQIVIFEIASKKIRRELAGHAGALVSTLAYSPDGLLASGSWDTTALVWQAGLPTVTAVAAKNGSGLETAFTQMAGRDARKAFAAMVRLAEAPQQAVRLLAAKIAPAAKPDLQGRGVAEWIGDLSSATFAVRAKASELLLRIGPHVEADLHKALAQPRDLETKRRIEDVLARLAARDLTQQEILHVRGVEVVEAIATPEARKLLSRWTTGEPGAVLTEHAQAALRRMDTQRAVSSER
jgi:hypothetical protein